MAKQKTGRPSLNNALEECEGLTTRSSGLPYMKDICIICQKQCGKLHWVEFKTTGQNMLQVSKMLTDISFFRRLNTITSAEAAVANDVLYHHQSWVIAKKKAKPKSSKPEDHVHTLSETELINFVDDKFLLIVCDDKDMLRILLHFFGDLSDLPISLLNITLCHYI